VTRLNQQDLQSFIERLDIMRNWALLEGDRQATQTTRATTSDERSSAAADRELPCSTAAVRIRRPTLVDIDRALGRIAQGLYATCLECEGSIARERLLTEPAAIRCRACHLKLPAQDPDAR
jgi:RNA polymerase-binding transcription factor DksA